MTSVSQNSFLMKAWKKHKKTDDYINTRHWAQFKEHVDGSLWATFVKGWEENESKIKQLEVEKKKLREAIEFELKQFMLIEGQRERLEKALEGK